MIWVNFESCENALGALEAFHLVQFLKRPLPNQDVADFPSLFNDANRQLRLACAIYSRAAIAAAGTKSGDRRFASIAASRFSIEFSSSMTSAAWDNAKTASQRL